MNLTFETALVHLKQGKRIRRANWPKELFLQKRRVSDVFGEEYDDIEEKWADDDQYPPFNASWFCSSDLLEEDWEVVE
jgi:hypothetical protein